MSERFFPERGAVEFAVEFYDWYRIVELINNGADVNDPDPDTGRTALMTAILRNGYETGVRYLLMRGADVNSRDRDGDSPLDFARYVKSERIVKLLLRYGATGKEGPSALEENWDAYYDAMASVNLAKRIALNTKK